MSAEVGNCWGHSEREAGENKIKKFLETPVQFVNESFKILIKEGSLSKETSLKELEDVYANSAAWRKIDNGGLLSIPVEEFRMINPPKPDRGGNVQFVERKGKGAGNRIENYPIAQTISDLNEIILDSTRLKKTRPCLLESQK